MASSSNDDEIITFKFSNLVCREDDDLKQKIKNLQCPFIWNPTDEIYGSNKAVCKMILSLTETKIKGAEDEHSEEEEYQLPWTKFVLYIILCYEYAKSGKIEKAFLMEKECMKILKNTSVPIPHMPKMGIGLQHVTMACKIFLFLENKEYNQVDNLFKEIPKVDDMASQDQASIWALRGAVLLEYGEIGKKESIPIFKHALQLDPTCGELHFLLGKSMSRVRRIEALGSKPCDLEIKSLETAAKIFNSPYVNCILAHTYEDVAFSYAKKSKQVKKMKNVPKNSEESLMYQKAFNIYKKTLQDGNCNRAVLTRIASGLINFPKEWQDLDKAEECVKRAFEKSSNDCYLNIIAGKLYTRKKDICKAKKHFTEAVKFGNFYGVQQLLILNVRHTPFYNPVPDIEKYLKNDNFAGIEFQHTLLSWQGFYYYKKESNFKKALQCWRQVFTQDIESKLLKEMKNPWEPRWPHTSNIHQIIVQELEERMKLNIFDQEELNMYKEALEIYKQNFPHLVRNIL